MTRRAVFRGQPLLLHGGVLAAWLLLRVMLWQSPFAPLPERPRLVSADAAAAGVRTAAVSREQVSHWPRRWPPSAGPGANFMPRPVLPAPWTAPGPAEPAGPAPPPLVPAPPPKPSLDPPRVAVGHSLLLALALSRMQPPAPLLAYFQDGMPKPAVTAKGAPTPSPQGRRSESRWSADGWLVLRRDGKGGLPGPLLSDRPGYGRGQAGAVARYELAPSSGARPRVHLRAAAALAGPRDREVAAGFSLRPVPGLPLRAYAEARASETAAGTRVRPAAYAVTELPPLALPLGARGEAYLQGGYVGGDFATAFVDGQVRADWPLARLGEGEFSAGAGVWGGAQKGAGRLDIGPGAAVTFRLGEARARIAADYRFRVAGDAEPESGPALTVSAGF